MPHTTREQAPVSPIPAQRPGPGRPAVGAGQDAPASGERRGCLFALSQLPLILFLAVIGLLLLFTAVHDLFLL